MNHLNDGLLDESKGRTSRSGYMPQLDGLRAFGVGSVALSHWIPSQYQLGLPCGGLLVSNFSLSLVDF
jgi:peptidoglycan/LPS O-acetylase OafA/YrhL